MFRLVPIRKSPRRLQGRGRDKSLVRTGCCLLSMLTSDAPHGSRSAAPGSSSNPSSLPFQVSRRAQFPS